MALWPVLLSRPSHTPIASRPSLTLFFLLVGAFILTLVPQVPNFPLWLSATIVIAMVLRCFIEFYRLPLPSTTFCGILAIVLLGIIFAQYATVMGRDAGTAFTAGLLAIKFYELRRPRDVSLIIFSCFFVIMSALLYSQVLELFIYCLIMMRVLTSLLLRVHTGDFAQDHLLRMLGKSGAIFFQALPLVLCLFFFFPRYPGKLSFSLDESRIGLTDTVSPGSIAKLSQDDSEVMYVHFTSSNIPTIDSMYWRALVLWDYHNGAWTTGNFALMPGANLPPAPDPHEIKQEIVIRAHYQKWLFALDVPVSRPMSSADPTSWATLLNGNVVQLLESRLNHTARYNVASDIAPFVQNLNEREANASLQLPTGNDTIDPRVKELADSLYPDSSDKPEQGYIYAVLKYFRHGSFEYTTAPGVQGPNWLPIFLFKEKKGFCEHFASAFAILMRLEKIPARLVVGYQGADYNPYTNNYNVSQSNAHAWDEVWMPSDNLPPATSTKGRWLRIDPTALVTMAEEMPGSNGGLDTQDNLAHQVAHHDPTFAENYLPEWLRSGLKEMQLRRELVETGWDNLVLGYDPEAQFRMAQALGFGETAQTSLFLICVLVGAVCLVVFRKWFSRGAPVSPIEHLYATFCHTMTRRGIPRAIWEGPLAYTGRVAQAFPDEGPVIRRVGSLVATARYGHLPANACTPQDLKSLLTLITASHASTLPRDHS